MDGRLAGGNVHDGIAHVDPVAVLGAQDAGHRGVGRATDVDGHVDAVGGRPLPRDQAGVDGAAGDADRHVHQRPDEHREQEGDPDPGADGPAAEAVPLLHGGAELVPGERRGHVGETIPVTAPLRLMAVHAHPDDESSKGAATTAKYAAEGVDVMVVTCTGGERGDVLNASAQADVDARGLLAVRRARWPRPPPSWASGTHGSDSRTPGIPRATRDHRCRWAASPTCRSSRRSSRWCA